MRRWRASTDRARGLEWQDDSGSAALEFIVVGLLLLVPLVYLVITLSTVQHQSLGAEAAARHIARAISTSSGSSAADDRAHRILASVVDEYGMDSRAVTIDVECRPAGECPQAGALVVVTVAATVSLPLVPDVLGLDRLAQVPVEATSVQKVSRTWSEG
ncbi:TadE family protein [Microbacterium sp. SSW1-59]|uniref:TadE/TadG family type IV pilus assembly protein n=1 Tax=Microbacterium xanthum TaxID=3079794 RepID=UPI002AD36F68|nr:TadE/TadG family type IV pilus assembly protein [Microbacterium sp. SSW1-59]MDZ8202075.1 TadE family protein [Microbacterium sp. SSW1-59]